CRAAWRSWSSRRGGGMEEVGWGAISLLMAVLPGTSELMISILKYIHGEGQSRKKAKKWGGCLTAEGGRALMKPSGAAGAAGRSRLAGEGGNYADRAWDRPAGAAGIMQTGAVIC